MEEHQIRYYLDLYENEIKHIFICLYRYRSLFDSSLILPLEIIHFIIVLYFDIKLKRKDSIYCGHQYSLILKEDNILIGGNNNNFQLGLKEYNPDFLCLDDPCYQLKKYVHNNFKMKDIQSVSIGENHSFYVMKNGSLYGCGYNNYGQLGDYMTYLIYQTHTKINISNVLSASCGENHSMVITVDGLFSAGRNNRYQLGLGYLGNSSDGKDIVISTYFQKVNLLDVLSMACGDNYSMALTKEGLFGCGDNFSYQLGLDIVFDDSYKFFRKIDLLDVISFSCGGVYSFVLTKNGLFVSGQFNQYTTIRKFTKINISNVISFSCGHYCSMVLTTNGLFLFDEMYDDNKKMILDNACSQKTRLDIKNVISFSCSNDHSIISTKEGLFGYGSNRYGQIGLGESILKDHHTNKRRNFYLRKIDYINQ